MKKIIWFFIITQAALSQLKYELPCKQELLLKSEQIALEQVGTKELTGKNDGRQVEIYQITVGLPKGSAYCAAGQYYCYYQACYQLQLNYNEIPFPKTGLANKVFNFAAINGQKKHYVPKRHDFIVWRNGSTPFGHIERIISKGKAGWVKTVAFNTSLNNVQGVHIKKRNIYHPLSRMKVRGLVGFYSI